MSGAVQALIGSLKAAVSGGDPNWSSVTLLLPGNGTNGAQNNTFIDSSANNFTITRNGNTTQGTFAPFSITPPYSTSTRGGSGYFDGTGDYLTVADNAALEIGASSFCIEGWIYLPSLPSSGNRYSVLGKWTLGQYSYIFNVYNNSGTMQLELFYSTNGSTASSIVENAAITAGTWHHIAITRDSTTCRFFLNGTQQGSNQTVSATFYNGTAAVDVGRHGDNINYLPGYISSCRLVIGTAVYTSNFTPSTTPLTAITNTSLLLNFTNAGIIDNAMLNDLETVGNAQISTAQSKFGGSSMYFDGTGDYLVSNSDANNYAFGSGDFTIEMWLYLSTTAGTQIVYDSRPSATQGVYPTIYCDAGTIKLFVSSADRITGSALSATTWYHIALARSGTSTKLFVDGVQVGSTYTDTNSYLNPSQRPIIASSGNTINSSLLTGYIDDLRITKGVARYTANFTPPAAAFPTS